MKEPDSLKQLVEAETRRVVETFCKRLNAQSPDPEQIAELVRSTGRMNFSEFFSNRDKLRYAQGWHR